MAVRHAKSPEDRRREIAREFELINREIEMLRLSALAAAGQKEQVEDGTPKPVAAPAVAAEFAAK